MAGKSFEKRDKAADKKAGIRENSRRDTKIDARGGKRKARKGK